MRYGALTPSLKGGRTIPGPSQYATSARREQSCVGCSRTELLYIREFLSQASICLPINSLYSDEFSQNFLS